MQSIYNMFSYMYNPPFHHDETSLVHVLVSFHNQLLVAAQIVMVLYYPRLYNKIKPAWLLLIFTLTALLLVTLFREAESGKVVETMDTAMVIDGFFKYVPQILLNMERKSTSGWSIVAVFLDMSSAIMTFFGYVLKNIDNGESRMFVHSMSVVKFMLLIGTLGFQIVFLVQHFLIFANPESFKIKTDDSSDDTLIKSSKRVAEQKNRFKQAATSEKDSEQNDHYNES